MGSSYFPVTRKRANENSRELPTSLEEVTVRVEEQSFDCVCGRSFPTLKGRNIHRGRMKCNWISDDLLGSEPVISREEPSQDQNHSARDIHYLMSEKHGVSPPVGRNEKICWPASNDKVWLEFDDRVCKKVIEAQKNKPFQEKMKVHCEVVYDEAVRWFGIVEKAKKEAPASCYFNRRQKQIDSLVRERRTLRKKFKRACSDIERGSCGSLLKDVAVRLKKLRQAEARKKKQRERRKVNKLFKNDPFRTIKNVLSPNPAGVLKCTKEELDSHLERTYGDPIRNVPLGVLEGLPDRSSDPEVPFNMKDISRKEHNGVIQKARSKSSPGNNGLPYLVYKRCPNISENLWVLCRLAFKTADYPDNCRFFEGVYIPKVEGDFGPSEGRPISLGNVQGKIYMAILAKRLTEYVLQNRYVDTSVQKGGVPKVRGCIEHFGAMWEVIKDAKMNRRDLCVVWLDLANAYGAVPHVLIIKALRYYNIPTKIINIVILYFSGVYGRFSSRSVTSNWQKFEIGIFMGCVISVIIFVLVMNLADEYLKVKIPKAVQYYKGDFPVPLMKLFMDDACLATALTHDMNNVLTFFNKFVDWSRFKLKAPKSRALVFKLGKAVKWFLDNVEGTGSSVDVAEGVEGADGEVVVEEAVDSDDLVGGDVIDDEKIYIGEEVIPNVCEKPIKFVGRWIREDAKDTGITSDIKKDLIGYLERLDKSELSGLQKCWGYQFMVLSKMKWPLAIYDIPLTTVISWEQKTNKFLRSWLGAGHTLSRLCLFSNDSGVALPIDSLVDIWKIEKCRLQQSYNTTPDTFVKSIEPKVRSGKLWSASVALSNARRDLECEAMRGMIQPHFRSGIGFGEWIKPWERLSEREKQDTVLGRVKKNIDQERQCQYGTLEMQCRWVNWNDGVLPMDLSWNNMFKLGDSLVGFALSVVYGTVITPAMKSNWDADEDGNCKLCETRRGTIQHILSGCPVALQQGRYTWRHDKVLKQIHEQVSYHVNQRVNNPKRSIGGKVSNIDFVASGKNVTSSLRKARNDGNMGIITAAKDWIVIADIGKRLKFPNVGQVETLLRPDLIIYSNSTKRIIWWELTCPSEERIEESHKLKLDRYADLKVACETAGWSCYNLAIEVGARGCVADSLQKAATSIGLRGRAVKKLVREAGQEALHCSKWIYWLSGKKEWEYRNVVPDSVI